MSFGTVSTRYATTAPRIADKSAVPMRSDRTLMALLLLPAELSDERHELRAAPIFDAPLSAGARHARESLRAAGADRDYEFPRSLQLLKKRFGNFRRRGSDDDAIERRLIRPSVCAVEHFRRHVVDLQFADQLRRAKSQLVDAFDGKDFRAQLRQHHRLISRSRANLQHLLIAGEIEQLDHARHDVRLRDRLLRSDRQRARTVRLRRDE